MTFKTVLLSAMLVTASAASAEQFVTNGGFESTSNGANNFLHLTNPTGWTSGNFVDAIYAPGAADTVGAFQGDPNRPIYLWGPGDGTANGLTATSPAGGNYLALDSDPSFHAPLSQTISGLTVGDTYTLSFWYAAAQYNDRMGNWNGASFSGYQVSFGSDVFTAPAINIASHGFSGWVYQSFTTVATSTSQSLSFLAVGGPGGLPPVALLDGVSLTGGVPDTASWAMLIAGFGLVGAAARRRRAVVAA